MQINLNNNISYNKSKTSFGHGNPWSDSHYNKTEQAIIATTTALGVAASFALLAKSEGYSLKPKNLFKNLKNSYFCKVKYDEKPVIGIGAGSCLGGLLGGFIVDHDKENRKAKLRETLLQVTNISVPILFVVYAAKVGKHLGHKFLEKGNKETLRTKIPKSIGAIAGLFAGVYTGNIVGNKINEKIYHRGKGRSVQASDFSAHLDDFCLAAQQISDNKIIHGISRLVPFALMIAGNEVGNKTAYSGH